MRKSLPLVDAAISSPPGDARAPQGADPALASRKLAALQSDLAVRLPDGILVAFSGGVDSAFLLWAAREARPDGAGRVVALTTTSASTPSRDREDAEEFTRLLGVKHVWRESQEVSLPRYARNDRERCYHCKAELFRIASEVAGEEKLRWLAYGYNASDHDDDRPGQRAAAERGVLAPLSDAGLTKDEIRLLMREAGLPLAGKPASPCLSSRIMTGIEITPERLRHVEELEAILRRAGASNLRVRVCRAQDGSWFLRVEVVPDEMTAVLACREELERTGTDMGYKWVTLDLGGYRTGGGVL